MSEEATYKVGDRRVFLFDRHRVSWRPKWTSGPASSPYRSHWCFNIPNHDSYYRTYDSPHFVLYPQDADLNEIPEMIICDCVDISEVTIFSGRHQYLWCIVEEGEESEN